MEYDLAFPWRVKREPGNPDWARTAHAMRSLALDGRADVALAVGDPGPRPPRAQLGPAYARAYARARHAAGYTACLVYDPDPETAASEEES